MAANGPTPVKMGASFAGRPVEQYFTFFYLSNLLK